MRVAASLLIAAVGLVLAIAVHPASPGAIDINTVGWILFAVGLVGVILELSYRRRTRPTRSPAT